MIRTYELRVTSPCRLGSSIIKTASLRVTSQAEVIPGLSSPGGTLMTDGCHGASATGITVIDSRLILRVIRLGPGPPRACSNFKGAVVARPRATSQLTRRGGLRLRRPGATADSDRDLSKHTIVAGPHACQWRHGSRPSPSAQAGQELNTARGRCASPAGKKDSPAAGIKGQPRSRRHCQPCGNKGTGPAGIKSPIRDSRSIPSRFFP